MPDWLRGMIVILVLCIAVSVLGLMNSRTLSGSAQGSGGQTTTEDEIPTVIQLPDKKLSCFNLDGTTFENALADAKGYSMDNPPAAIVVPHHMTAASLVSGAFKAASSMAEYDSVIVIAPNHEADMADIVLTDKGWNVGDGLDCDADLLERLTGAWNSSAGYAFSDSKLEQDHSASALIPFIDYYFKDAKVLPALVSKSLTLDETLFIADNIYNTIKDSGKNVLLICSIDFSHYLTSEQSRVKDAQTLEAIKRSDYTAIHSFTNDNLDSPASLIIFLRFLELSGRSVTVLDNTDASSYSDTPVVSTTSYFILAG